MTCTSDAFVVPPGYLLINVDGVLISRELFTALSDSANEGVTFTLIKTGVDQAVTLETHHCGPNLVPNEIGYCGEIYVAQYHSVSVSTVRRWRDTWKDGKKGIGPRPFKFGKSVRYRLCDLHHAEYPPPIIIENKFTPEQLETFKSAWSDATNFIRKPRP